MNDLSEKAVLGTLLAENHLIQDTSLQAELFEIERHQKIFKALKYLSDKGKPADVITLASTGRIEELGGITYLNDLQAYADVNKFEDYEGLVREDWKEREKRKILQLANVNDWPIKQVIEELDKIDETKTDDHTDIRASLAKRYDDPWVEKEPEKGAPTGIDQLQRMTNGWQDSELVILAARPSMGKSDVMLHFAKQAGWGGYVPIIFSLEMPEKSLTTRMIASTAGYNRSKMRDVYRYLSDAQKKKWAEAVGRLSETCLQVFDSSGQTLRDIRSKVRKVTKDFPDKKPIVLIDYLTLIKPESSLDGSVHQQIGDITKGLKKIAKDFVCPVICLAQLSRGVEQRQDKRPMLSDLRESGSIEEDADAVLFLYRESYYNKETDDTTLEMILAKQRNGPVGTVYAEYNKHTGAIENVHYQAVV